LGDVVSEGEPGAAPDGAAGVDSDPIILWGSDVLHQRCDPIQPGVEAQALVERMFASMYAANGVGLAANQIGVSAQAFVVDCPDAKGQRVIGHVLNPVLVETDAPRVLDVDEEGCLSVPGAHALVARPDYAVVEGVDAEGKAVRFEGTGLLARCLQHEMDHLEGRVYVERLPSKERGRVLREAGFEA
jgi:peptide deformylase